MDYLDRAVTTLKGVGETRAKQLAKLGIITLRDLVYYFPRAYEKRGDTRLLGSVYPDLTCSVILTVGSAVKSTRQKQYMQEVISWRTEVRDVQP